MIRSLDHPISELGRFLELLGLAARHGDFETAVQLDEIAAIGPCMDALNKVEIDDLLAVGAEEQSAIQPVLQVIQGA